MNLEKLICACTLVRLQACKPASLHSCAHRHSAALALLRTCALARLRTCALARLQLAHWHFDALMLSVKIGKVLGRSDYAIYSQRLYAGETYSCCRFG